MSESGEKLAKLEKDVEYIKGGIDEIKEGFKGCRSHCHQQTDAFNTTITRHDEQIKTLFNKFSTQTKIVIGVVVGTTVTLVKIFLLG